MQLAEVLSALEAMPPAARAKLTADLEPRVWVPNPGPQTEAYFSEADETLFGGEAGGGKSDLGLGLALTQHRRSLLLRRINADAAAMGDRLVEILGDSDGYNASTHRYKNAERLVELGGCEQEKDKQRFKGRPHDLKFFDELADFLESQYLFIIGWNRSAHPGQRCRVVAATNPPTTAEGQWIVKRWAPWLDPTHPRPAKSGELRWFLTVDGEDVEVEGPGPHVVAGRKDPVRATSRTFIRSGLSDNPDLDVDGQYAARLEALPEELRKAYREGDFTVGAKDGEFQVIPTDWIVAAQNRWKENGYVGVQMTALACDPAGGGNDAQVITARYGGWFPEFKGAFEPKKGPDTADPNVAAADVIRARRNRCPVVVDSGGGYGTGLILRLGDNAVEQVVAYKGANASDKVTKDGLRFANKRSADWWTLREELDPNQEGGSAIALPPDPELRADLAAPTWRLTAQGIQVEPKVVIGPDGKITGGIRKRLGRSPGKGDVVVMCLAEGSRAVMRNHSMSVVEREKQGLGGGQLPRVVMSRNRGHRR